MICRPRNPASLSPEERLAEIAAILATGYRRLSLSRESDHKELAETPESEAPCDSGVDGNQSEGGKEVA